jgi:putative ABC transport system ATP-binding protein
MSLIKAEGLTKIYGKGETAVTALDSVSMSVDTGEFVAVMGPSGCGKSTLLYLLGGLDHPTSGTVWIDGQSLSDLKDNALTILRRRRIGFIFQFYNLIPILTAVENTALPVTLDGLRSSKAKAKASTWLERVGLGDRLNSRPDQLSGGEQQRVAIARALVAEPTLVLADEPTGNLDTHASDEIADLLSQVANEWGRAVVMVTHDPRVASRADRVLLLKDGVIVDDIRPEPQEAGAALWAESLVRLI